MRVIWAHFPHCKIGSVSVSSLFSQENTIVHQSFWNSDADVLHGPEMCVQIPLSIIQARLVLQSSKFHQNMNKPFFRIQ